MTKHYANAWSLIFHFFLRALCALCGESGIAEIIIDRFLTGVGNRANEAEPSMLAFRPREAGKCMIASPGDGQANLVKAADVKLCGSGCACGAGASALRIHWGAWGNAPVWFAGALPQAPAR